MDNKLIFFGDFAINDNRYIDIYVRNYLAGETYLMNGISGGIKIYNNVDNSYFELDLTKINDYELVQSTYNADSFYKIKYKRPSYEFTFTKFEYRAFNLLHNNHENTYLSSVFKHSAEIEGISFSSYTCQPNSCITAGILNCIDIFHPIQENNKVAYIFLDACISGLTPTPTPIPAPKPIPV